MSVCEQCFIPGRCCSGFSLSITHLEGLSGKNRIEAERAIKEELPKVIGYSVPFVPTHRHPDPNIEWLYYCPELDCNGRCKIYEDRPDVCRRFVPCLDSMCLHYEAMESGDGSADYGLIEERDRVTHLCYNKLSHDTEAPFTSMGRPSTSDDGARDKGPGS